LAGYRKPHHLHAEGTQGSTSSAAEQRTFSHEGSGFSSAGRLSDFRLKDRPLALNAPFVATDTFARLRLTDRHGCRSPRGMPLQGTVRPPVAESVIKRFAILLGILLALGGAVGSWGADPSPPAKPPAALAWPAHLPVYDHVVIVVEENKDYEQIIGKSDAAPYINGTLRAQGANLTQAYGEEHDSQGNYFWLFSGSNQNVGFTDVVPNASNQKHFPFTTPNLGKALLDKGRKFKGYAEDLPAIGSIVDRCDARGVTVYARKHVPWISFGNVPNGNTVETSSNLRFADFPKDAAGFAELPTVAFVIPNLNNDMHNGKPEHSIPAGDTWLKTNLDDYYRWAKAHNSLLIVTWDESDKKTHQLYGLTNPLVQPTNHLTRDIQNHIPTIFAGAHIKHGEYPEGKGVTHVNILRTLEAMYGLPRSGAQQPNAAAAGIADDYLITDIFERVK
jgi:acid phosphatase